MADEDVVIVSTGMMTAVGLSAAETAASVRAATMRFIATPFMDMAFQPFTLAVVPDDGLPDLEDAVKDEPGLSSRELRMLRLGTMPLKECLKPLAGDNALGLVLATSEADTNRQRFLNLLCKQTKMSFDPSKSEFDLKGRAGGVAAVGRAARRVREGKSSFVVAGGVDTYRDPYLLGTLDLEKRIKTFQHLDAFIPGEGAGFVLLTNRKIAKAKGLTPLATVLPHAEGIEEGHLYSDQTYKGEGLAATITKLFEESGVKEPIEEVFSSMNGEGFWAKEWGVSFLRNRAKFNPQHATQHPADCFGDTGAAHGPLMIALAAIGMTRGYRRSPTLVYGSNDRAERAALILKNAGKG